MNSDINNFYNKNLKTFARANRKGMTKAEACLWKYALRGKQMGHTFNRQRPVLNYIADFMCKELKLIIEVDGITHTFEVVIQKDVIRQRKLEEAGFRVIRFKDADVLMDIRRVRDVISGTIEELLANRASGSAHAQLRGPSPVLRTPPQRGG